MSNCGDEAEKEWPALRTRKDDRQARMVTNAGMQGSAMFCSLAQTKEAVLVCAKGLLLCIHRWSKILDPYRASSSCNQRMLCCFGLGQVIRSSLPGSTAAARELGYGRQFRGKAGGRSPCWRHAIFGSPSGENSNESQRSFCVTSFSTGPTFLVGSCTCLPPWLPRRCLECWKLIEICRDGKINSQNLLTNFARKNARKRRRYKINIRFRSSFNST